MSRRFTVKVVSDSISEHGEPLAMILADASLPLRSFGFLVPVCFDFLLDQIRNEERHYWPDLILFREDLEQGYLVDSILSLRDYESDIWFGVLALRFDTEMARKYAGISCRSYLSASDVDGVKRLVLDLAAQKRANENAPPTSRPARS